MKNASRALTLKSCLRQTQPYLAGLSPSKPDTPLYVEMLFNIFRYYFTIKQVNDAVGVVGIVW